MKRSGWRLLAVHSLMLVALATRAAQSETRPQYGGTLHVFMREGPTSLDPAALDPADGGVNSIARRNVTLLMFETLVATDDGGKDRPALATSWQSAANQRWRFDIRRGVKFQDGTPLTAEIAAVSLRAANPSWNVLAERDSVVIETNAGGPELLAELALARNAIAKRNPDGRPSGTGSFHVVDWQPGKKLILGAEEGYWRGRPFVDGIEIEMGKSYRDQMTALELGRADLVEVAAEQAHRASLDGRRMENSAPMELLALVFARDARTPEEKLLRESLAWSVERGSIRSVLLQGAGQPAGGILPNWISGYGFVFPTDADLQRARHLRDQARTAPAWSLGYDVSDPLARLLAERIALNAKDAGLSLQPSSTAAADVRVVRIGLASADPWLALNSVAAAAGIPSSKRVSSVEDLYAAEQAALAAQRIIPLFHLPQYYAASGTLKDWSVRPDGSWNLADSWMGSGKP